MLLKADNISLNCTIPMSAKWCKYSDVYSPLINTLFQSDV